jgi:hypothetical protein
MQMFMKITYRILLTVRNVADKRCRQNQNTDLNYNNVSPKTGRLCNNVKKFCTAGQGTEGNIIRRMRSTCWITKLQTHSEHVIHCFSATSIITRTPLNVTSYVHSYVTVLVLSVKHNYYNLLMSLFVYLATCFGHLFGHLQAILWVCIFYLHYYTYNTLISILL